MEKNNFNTVKNYFPFRECLEILKKDKSKASKGNKCTKAINAGVDRGNSTGSHPRCGATGSQWQQKSETNFLLRKDAW